MGHTPTIIDGEEYPSVTQIVDVLDKPFLLRWYGMNGWTACEKKKKESAEKGTKFHASVEQALKFVSGKLEIEPDWNEDVEAVIRWAGYVGFIPDTFEQKVVSRKHKYGGTFDCSGMLSEGRGCLVDWKRTAQVSIHNSLQLGGYYGAYLEQTGIKLSEARIIRPYELQRIAKKNEIKGTKNGSRYSFEGLKTYVEERVYRNLDQQFEMFLKCRNIWDFIHQKGLWGVN